MLTREQFTSLLTSHRALVIDGALATELENRGYEPDAALWSAKFLLDEESQTGLVRLHQDYFAAGADIAITCSYQASTQGLTDHLSLTEDEGKDLIRRSVLLAQHAREAAYENGVPRSRRLLIAGSVGPYGAYLADGSEYRGDYVRTSEELQDFHRPRIQALVDAGVDVLALETIPSFAEIKALLGLLKAEFPQAVAWLSCSIRNPQHISDGTGWQDVFRTVEAHRDQIVAAGINCVPLSAVTDTLREISKLTDIPLICYPNSGEVWDAQSRTWRNDSTATQSPLVRDWLSQGARLIGGCCRTGPAFVKAVRDSID